MSKHLVLLMVLAILSIVVAYRQTTRTFCGDGTYEVLARKCGCFANEIVIDFTGTYLDDIAKLKTVKK